MQRLTILAVIGGMGLGLVLGAASGAFIGRHFTIVEAWEEKELYGFFALAERIRGFGLGAVIGGFIGASAGACLALIPFRRRNKA